jgi:uncharacterized protein
MAKLKFIFITLFVSVASLAAQPSHAITKVEVPYLSGPVVDEIQLLNASERNQIVDLLKKMHLSGKAQMAVLIPQSLQGFDIETYSIAVAEAWKLGSQKTDQGVILVIAPKERSMRIEVGYGLEGDLTDAFCSKIIHEVLAPYFRAGRFSDGILLAIESIAQKINIDLTAPVGQRLRASELTDQIGNVRKIPVSLIVVIIIFLFFSSLASRSTRRFGRNRGIWDGGGGGGWGGGFGGGGGGFGGGGGGFGGGGASGKW